MYEQLALIEIFAAAIHDQNEKKSSKSFAPFEKRDFESLQNANIH